MKIPLLRGHVDRRSGRGTVAGRPVRLTARQQKLLGTLVDAGGALVPRAVLEEVLGANARAVDLVMLRLRRQVEVDPSAPAHLLSVFGEGYRFVPAPAGGMDHPGLPPERTTLVGRDAERAAVVLALADRGRVTLVGVGGAGKTALALRVAREAAFAHAVFVRLSGLAAGHELPGALARALGVPTVGLDSEAAVVARVAGGLRDRPGTLLVFDGAEHLVDAVRALLDELARRAPHASALVTSRVAVGAEGERVIEVPPLATAAAVDLFVARARAVDVSLDPSDPRIAQLVERLDHLPLLLELAAARARALSPGSMLERLDERFRLLSGARADDPRHRSLEATLQWSWDLTPEADRRALAALSVFRGPASPEAARAVIGPDADARVASLLATSWAHRERGGVGLLDSVRAWGERQAAALGVADEAELRHARYFADLALRVRGEGPITAARMDALDEVLPDLLAAARARDPDAGVRIVRALNDRYHARGPYAPFVALLDRVASHVRPEDDRRIQYLRGSILRVVGRRDEAKAALEYALAGADPELAGRAWNDLGALAAFEGRSADARHAFQRALEAPLDRTNRCIVGASSAWVAFELGHREEAEALGRRAIEDGDAAGAALQAAGARATLAAILQNVGRADEAEALLERALVDAEACHGEARAANVRYTLAVLRAEAGAFDAASALLDAAERTWDLLGRDPPRLWARVLRAEMALGSGAPAEALARLDGIEPWVERYGGRYGWSLVWGDRAVALAQLGQLADAEVALATATARGASAVRVQLLTAHLHLARAATAADPAPHLAIVEAARALAPADGSDRFLRRLLG